MAGAIRFSNNGSGLLAAGIGDIDTSLTLESGKGSLFPSPSPGQYALLTIEDTLGNIEIVRMTSRAGDVLTVTRAQEGTIALSFASGSRVELRVTAGLLNELIQRSGDTFTGDLDFTGGGTVTGAQFNDGEVVNTPIRGDAGVTSNQFVVPSGGGAPTIGGSMVYHTGNLTVSVLQGLILPVGMIMMWHGTLGSIPAGWQVCDGTVGTPNLMDKFVIGAGNTYSWTNTGGTTSYVSGAAGSHTHNIQPTVLAITDIPAHTHKLWALSGSGSYGEVQGFGNNNDNVIAGDGGSPKGYITTNFNGTQLVESTGGGGGHAHTADNVGDHTHTVENVLPPYYALFFIMRV